MAKMRLSHENTKNLSPDIHQLCQYLARLEGIWQNKEAFIVAAFLLWFAFKSLSLRKSKTRPSWIKQKHTKLTRRKN